MKAMHWDKLVATRHDFKLISLDRIDPNPFRDMKRYPINQEKLDALKASFQSDAPWKSSHWMVREHPTKKGRYQLHFGHHRFFALKELGCVEWRFAVENVDDATMLKRMANENGETYANDAEVATETVYAIKKFLEDALRKCSDYKDFSSEEFFRANFPSIQSEPAFRAVKGTMKPGGKGVGRDIIYIFLGGDGISQWSTYTIQTALATINLTEEDPHVSKKAMDKLPKLSSKTEFRQQVKKHKIPKEKQVELAEKLKDTGRRQIAKVVRAAAPKTKKDASQEIEEKFDSIINQTRTLETNILGLQATCNDHNVTTLQGKSVDAGWLALISCAKEIMDFVKLFNGNYEDKDNAITTEV